MQMLDFVFVLVGLSAIIHGPRNTVVVDGSKATFTCLTDLDLDELCWDYRDEGQQLVTVCNPDGCRSPRHSVDTSVNNDLRRHSFMIDSCNATHSGRYICGDCNDRRARKTAYLVVLGTSSTSLFKHGRRALLVFLIVPMIFFC